MLSLEAALERVLAGISPLPVESVPLLQAHRRWLARNLASPIDLPPFDNSAMDGYAIRTDASLAHATPDHPARVRCIGEAAAGSMVRQPIGPGECLRIFTGAPLPPGADAVVMQEDTRPDPVDPSAVLVLDGVKPWENVRFQGEDVKAGVEIGQAGERLGFGRLALLGAAGCETIEVARRPRVGLLATGDELIEPGTPPGLGQIFESNRIMLKALAEETGCEVKLYPLVPDTHMGTQAALAAAFAECDVVITSGGVSVGAHDHVKAAFAELGGTLEVWRLAIRPGKPLAWGRLGARHFFGLPGNPVSAAVTFLLVVRPALIRLQGGTDTNLLRTRGALTQPLSNPGGRRHFVRVGISPVGEVAPAGLQGSHVLSSLSQAGGLVDVPAGADWETGRSVEVLLFP